jgi:hypothetical protein
MNRGAMFSAMTSLGGLYVTYATLAASLAAAQVASADIIGPTDDRVEVAPLLRPFVAEISRYDDTAYTLHRANGWLALHPQLLATAAHVLAQDGVFLANQKTTEPTLLELSTYEVKIAGCPAERYWITDILAIGTLDSIGNPAQDFAVALLNRPSCLSAEQLGAPLNIASLSASTTPYEDMTPPVARLDAFMPRIEVAQSLSRTGLTSLVTNGHDDVALFQSFGHIEPYYYRPVRGQSLVSTTDPDDPSSWSMALSWYGDADEGSSGGPVSILLAIELDGRKQVLNYVIGMQVQEISTPGVDQNIIVPYAGLFQKALEEAAEVARSLP